MLLIVNIAVCAYVGTSVKVILKMDNINSNIAHVPALIVLEQSKESKTRQDDTRLTLN